MKIKNGLPPVHPGEIIKQDIMPSAGLSVTALSVVMCLKIRLFDSMPEFWMRLQAAYDLKKAEQNKKIMQRVAPIVPVSLVSIDLGGHGTSLAPPKRTI